jgi:2-polyprenyl-3-methyl-5-hydroxy-6-metoxy-1,4-benzoquinol methylase
MRGDRSTFQGKPTLSNIASQACTADQFHESDYIRLAAAITQKPTFHRKQWEYIYILRALEQLGLTTPGTTGLGFGCGREPLTAVMAGHGLNLVITDIPPVGVVDPHWGSQSLMDSFYGGICPEDVYRRQVAFRAVDMNSIPDDLGLYDFLWSCCALEHLGSLQAGLDFIVKSTKCLKPGGFGIHTTEFNVSSDFDTLESPGLSLYRRLDLIKLQDRLIEANCSMMPINFYAGDLPEDLHIDLPPYAQTVHLKLQIGKYVVTSFGLVLRKNP